MIDPARFYTELLNTGLQTKDNPLYQLLRNLIGNIIQQQQFINLLVVPSGGFSVPWATFDGATVFIPYPIAIKSDSGTLSLGLARDVVLIRSGANVLSLVNGINRQKFRIYQADDGVGNFAYGNFSWSGNIFTIGALTSSDFIPVVTTRVYADSLISNFQNDINIVPGGTGSWKFRGDGSLRFLTATDSLGDIGDAAATGRPANIYLSNTIFAGFSAGIGIGSSAPLAEIELGAGTTFFAPLKFNSGPLLGTPLSGTVEFLTDDLSFTITTGAARKYFVFNDGAKLTSGKYPIASTNGRLIDGPTPLAGTKVYWVSDTNGGAVNRKLTFTNGILTAET